MSDPFLDARSSVEGAEPRLLYEIRQSLLVVYRITSGDRDVVWGGYTWIAEPVASTEIGESSNTSDFAVTLTLPIRHAFLQRYLAQGSPPKLITITIYEYQAEIDDAEQVWIGNVTSIAANMKEHVATILIPSRLTNSLERIVSSITVGKECPHILYGPDCKASDELHKVITTIESIDGRRIRVASIDPFYGDLTAFEGGDVTHVSTGESQTIFQQFADGRTMNMQAPMPDARIGDAIIIRTGCDHTMNDCHERYGNTPNYGGCPQLPLLDLFIPGNSTGIYGS